MSSRSSYSSRDRLLCALSHQEPDRVPLWCLWRGSWSGDAGSNLPIPIADQRRRAEAVLAMGLDDTLLLKPPGPREDELVRPEWVPSVTAEVWTEAQPRSTAGRDRSVEHGQPGAGHPLLVKQYLTPEGPLRQSVRLSQDWPFGNDIALWSDMNVIQGAEYLVKTGDDLRRLRYLLTEPTADQLAEFRTHARELRRLQQEKGVLIEGGWLTVVDAAVWLFGLDALVWKAVDEPDFVKQLLETIYQWERPRLELLLEARVDLVVHSGWYEMPHFWSPRLYREIIKPVLMKETELTHSAGVLFCYVLTAGSSLVLDDLLEIGVDVIRGVDPVQGHHDDLAVIKGRIGDRVAIWGGMNAAVTLEQGEPDEIRRAVDEAIRICGPGGGFVLYPVDQIWAHTPWSSVQVMIERWREVGRYPLSL